MTEDKTKVKDLATELGVPTKNLLQALRELDIPAKSTSSNIAAEDIDRVKNHLKDSATSEQGDRREVQPGVIVRRRRQSTEDVAAEGEEAPRAERRAPRENHTPTARIVSVPGASEAQDAAPVPSAEPEAPAAPEVSVQEPVKDAAEEKPAPVAEADKADDQKPRQPRDNRQKKRSGLREAAPVAKVISRPQDIAAAKAAEEAAAKAAAEAAAAAAKAAAAQRAEVREEAAIVSNSIILYNYSMSTLTPQEKTRLDLIAEQIKAGPRDRVYTIQGHADQQTGSKAGNRRVAENRAKRVYDYLVKQGVRPEQLTYKGLGDEKDIFNVQKANRAAIIK